MAMSAQGAKYPTSWAAWYTDAHGTEATTITFDGQHLRMTIRGVEFVGDDFDCFEPQEPIAHDIFTRFACLSSGHRTASLAECTIECDIRVRMVGTTEVSADLHVTVELGAVTDRGTLDRLVVKLSLLVDGKTYQSRGVSGWFEDEMLQLQATLPDGAYFKTCFNCAFSDYSIYGHGLFGNMMCFRSAKERYLAVTTKDEYAILMYETQVEKVAETYLCTEFERRSPGTGYRG